MRYDLRDPVDQFCDKSHSGRSAKRQRIGRGGCPFTALSKATTVRGQALASVRALMRLGK